MSSLINKAALNRYLLDRAKAMRPSHPLRHVSEEALEHLEFHLRHQADEMIRRPPSKGRPIKPLRLGLAVCLRLHARQLRVTSLLWGVAEKRSGQVRQPFFLLLATKDGKEI